MYYPDDGEQEDQRKDIFINEVMELLFGADAVLDDGNGKITRNFSYSEAIEELKAMNDVYTEYLINEDKN